MRRYFLLCWCIQCSLILCAQFPNPAAGYVFDDSSVPRIDVMIDIDSLDQLLAPSNRESNHEYPVRVTFTKNGWVDTLDNVGFRLRGNTSREAEKKSFKISVNSFEKGRNFYGLEKLNLNGEHNDPSLVRAKLAWDLFRDVGIPCSRANYVQFFINNENKGLYLNVEHIDEEFLQKRMQDPTGNLYKCLYPADLHYKGASPFLYSLPESWGRRAYDLKTNVVEFNYSDIAHLIDVFNNEMGEEFKCEIEKIFDVDAYLKVIAVDILISNWDGPIVNKNNFYLYREPLTNKFYYIPFDLDNTSGLDFFNVDWPRTDIYEWSKYSGEYRPLYDELMAYDEYRDRFSYYMNEIIDNLFNTQVLSSYFDDKQALIAPYREDDSYASLDYGWTTQDFINSFTQGFGGHVPYGVKGYVELRTQTAKDQLILNNVVPFAEVDSIDWSLEKIEFYISTSDDGNVSEVVFYSKAGDEEWIGNVLTLDTEGKAVFTHNVIETGILQYYIEITDDTGLSRSIPSCDFAEEYLGYRSTPNVVINELLASNTSGIKDEAEEYEDWIELYNNEPFPVNLRNMYLSDNPEDPSKWALPNKSLLPGEYLLIWADNDEEQGDYHAQFKLSKSGETLGLYDGLQNHYAPIDVVDYPEQATDISFARIPNGIGSFVQSSINTPKGNNEAVTSAKDRPLDPFVISVFPNPAEDKLSIVTPIGIAIVRTEILNMQGEKLRVYSKSNSLDLSDLLNGTYLVKVITINGDIATKLFVVGR